METETGPMSVVDPSVNRRLNIAIGWLIALVVLALLLGSSAPQDYETFSAPLELKVVFPVGIEGLTEPLVTTGKAGQGDFFAVRFIDSDTAVFVYDSWSSGGPASGPFPVKAGTAHRLTLQLPSVPSTAPLPAGGIGLLRVFLDGREVMKESVAFHHRESSQLYFATNPIGGTTADGSFRGTLSTQQGRLLRGGAAGLLSWPKRVRLLATKRPWFCLAAVLCAVVTAWTVQRLLWWLARHPLAKNPSRRFVAGPEPPHRWFIGIAAGAIFIFAALITGGTFHFLAADSFGIFYDYQAASLLHGRLDVPQSSLAGEAFMVHGKCYGYFGLTPALLRMPFVAAGIAFGKLSRLYMLTYFAIGLVAVYGLLCHATRIVVGPGAWPSRWAVTVLVSAACLGSTLLFLGSRAYIYHEAILCGATFALWSAWFSLRYLEAPERHAWIGALACGFISIQARPPSGLFALCVLGCAALTHVLRGKMTGSNSGALRHFCIAALAALAVLSFHGVSYLKFGTFDSEPLRYNVQYTPARLARFQGVNFHLSNLRHNIDAYFFRPDFHFEPHFPYFAFGGNERAYPGSMLDLTEPTVAFPYAMPGLFALATIGAVWALLFAPTVRKPLAVLALGSAPMALALFTAIATSHRYTADFCPCLITLGAFGLAVADAETPRWRKGFLIGYSLLALTSMTATLALALRYQGEMIWGVPDEIKRNYQDLRDRVDVFFSQAHRD
jgi:hypothetical protein